MKRTTKTVVKEYDTEGKLIKETETTVEETEDNNTISYIPSEPINPTTPINPYPWYPSQPWNPQNPIYNPITWTSSDNAKNFTITYKVEA